MSEEAQPLAGKIAIVVGAAGGIGSSIARRFAEAGAKVACVDRAPPEAVANAISDQGGEAVAIGCDITRPDETRKAAPPMIRRRASSTCRPKHGTTSSRLTSPGLTS
jgi:NAD(P)-dependent dehydrogenase (short-subunit alcohol dehydrogenase family)